MTEIREIQIGNETLRKGDKITFMYKNQSRIGKIDKLSIADRDGAEIVTCLLPNEKQFKAFRADKMSNLKRIKGFLALLFGR